MHHIADFGDCDDHRAYRIEDVAAVCKFAAIDSGQQAGWGGHAEFELTAQFEFESTLHAFLNIYASNVSGATGRHCVDRSASVGWSKCRLVVPLAMFPENQVSATFRREFPWQLNAQSSLADKYGLFIASI